MAQSSYEQVKQAVRDVERDLKDAYTFGPQRRQAQAYIDQLKNRLKKTYDKYAGSGAVAAPAENKAPAKSTASRRRVSGQAAGVPKRGPAKKKPAAGKRLTKRVNK